MEWLQGLDDSILLMINGANAPFADSFMWAVSGRLTWLPLYILVGFLLIRKFGWKRGLIYILIIVLTITVTNQLCHDLRKYVVQRLRPSNPLNPVSAMLHFVNDYHGGGFGFPSCHAANTFGFATLATLMIRSRILCVALAAWALLNCYSRLYLGVHYLSDLLAGALLGILLALLAYLSATRLPRRRHKLAPQVDER